MATNTMMSRPALLPRIGDTLLRGMEFLASCSAAARCGREVERLMQLSDDELKARGLTRDGIVRHVFARYMI